MKIFVVLLLGVAFAKATDDVCIPMRPVSISLVSTNPGEITPCFTKDPTTNETVNIGEAGETECALAGGCCMYEGKCVARDTGLGTDSDDVCIPARLVLIPEFVPCVTTEEGNCTLTGGCCMYEGICVKNDTGLATVSNDNGPATAELYDDAGAVVTQADDELASTSRSLLAIPPGLALKPGCLPPVPFPANCKITKHEPFVLNPPVNVPYCVRIPCKSIGNAKYDKSLKVCGSQAGCYFDKVLHEYREAFGPSVLPGVPVCHLAIRNRFFRQKSQEVVTKYRSWNPYFTNCLLKQFDSDIRKGPKGCELLPILDAFYVTPKMAGWKTINSYECALIDGCWRHGKGCFYPVDISQVRVKSGQREITFQKNEVVYGRPKCQAFDSSSPLNILKSYHRCLSAGCTVDSSVTSLYYNHFFSIGEGLTSENHWNFWTDVERGHVGAHNVESVIGEYGGYNKPSAKDTSGCGFPFRSFGGRPCPPLTIALGKPNKYCPYKPFFVPRFGVLKGSFEGCCDINLCYLPKSEISKMHSGPSIYYSEWSLYTQCSATCGPGKQKRYRRCISQDRKRCTEKLEESKQCNLGRCPGWGQWSSYSPCPVTCFPGGIQTRTRKCYPEGSFCGNDNEKVIRCNTHTCNGPHTIVSPSPTTTKPIVHGWRTTGRPTTENVFGDFFGFNE